MLDRRFIAAAISAATLPISAAPLIVAAPATAAKKCSSAKKIEKEGAGKGADEQEEGRHARQVRQLKS